MEYATEDKLTWENIQKFFDKPRNKKILKEKIIPILENKSNISLRFIEKYVAKYCAQNPTFIKTKDVHGKTQYIDVHGEYLSQLKSYGKKSCDVFKRQLTPNKTSETESVSSKSSGKTHHYFFIEKDVYLLTTKAQLNYFKWLIKSGILTYIEANYQSIKDKMDALPANSTTNRSRKKNKMSARSGIPAC